jgi:hypothetical protein
LEYTHVVPATQVPDPVQVCPPHCEYLGRVPVEAAVEDVVAEAVLVLVETTPVVVVVFNVVKLEELLPDPDDPPGPETDVVMEPLSTYTPLK